ncbi:hypothetical protein ILUMI_16152 [Ignelater luminosus]|uniref:Uncharacterized protein n=1 Tax=Ignelater luminosus TaxID=2038154 RepID=A0A8K0CRR7_IGNLU|nr:hypothetical protein ILUMI_16152 [Ignelater luminosus]
MITGGIETRIADEDADTSIVRCGVDKATTDCNTAIIGEAYFSSDREEGIHAFSRCDTTSFVDRKGKAQIGKMFGIHESLKAIADASSTPEEVSGAGIFESVNHKVKGGEEQMFRMKKGRAW